MDPLIPIAVFGGYFTIRHIQLTRAHAALLTGESEKVQLLRARVRKHKARQNEAYRKLRDLKNRLASHEDQKVRGCLRKKYFETAQEARQYIKDRQFTQLSVYSCPHCPGHHLTKKSQEHYP